MQPDVHAALERIEEFDRLSDTLAAHMPVAVKHKQKVLEVAKVVARFEYLLGLMESETDLLQIENAFVDVSKSKWKNTARLLFK